MLEVQPVDPILLRKYIAYARQKCHPKLTDEAATILVNSYVTTRNNVRSDTVPITVRNLLSMIRLSYACARMRLSNFVEARDAEQAVNIVMGTLSQVGVDPDTGELDSLVIEAGQSKTQFDRTKIVTDIVRSLSKISGKAMVSSVKEEAARHGISSERTDMILDRLRSTGQLFYPDWDSVKLV